MTEAVSLREFIERILSEHAEQHRQHQLAHDREHMAAQKALDAAAQMAAENKRDANEWRDAMTDRERSFARVEAMEQLRLDSDRRVSTLERANSQATGALNVARFIGFGGFLSGLAALVWVIVKGGP